MFKTGIIRPGVYFYHWCNRILFTFTFYVGQIARLLNHGHGELTPTNLGFSFSDEEKGK